PFTTPSTTQIYPLSLHDALPISEILGQHELPVSRETVRRFCREVLREKPRRSRKPLTSSPGSPATNGPIRSKTKTCSQNTAKPQDRKSTRLNSSHVSISYAVFCL